MRFEVYCDESYPDLLNSSKPQANHMLIGSIWLPSEKRAEFKRQIHLLRDLHKMGRGEVKWTKISKSRLPFYRALLDWFFEQGNDLRFRAIVVDIDQIDMVKFHDGDCELGFYKFYYQMIHHWLLDYNQYNIYCDYKSMSIKSRLDTLKKCLNNANRMAYVDTIQAVRSQESVLLQLNDILLGMVSAKFNRDFNPTSAKGSLIEYFEEIMQHPIAPSSRDERKFNVF